VIYININTKKLRGNLLLLLAAMIWGTTFVAQSMGMDYPISAFTFNGMRNMLGCLALLPVVAVGNAVKKRAGKPYQDDHKQLFRGGLFCGLALFCASSLQQYAFIYSTVGKIGFITALYMIFVPLLGMFVKKKAPPIVWVSVFIAGFGMYLLCVSGSLALNRGDLLSLGCAIGFAVHILCVDRFSKTVDCVKLSCAQFFVAGILSIACMFLFGSPKPELSPIIGALPHIVYAGIVSSGIAFTLQIVGQKHTEPAIASMLMCLESVFSVFSGWLFLSQSMSYRELGGCAVMFFAIILAQLPDTIPRLKALQDL